ncbi:MAG: electron transport complex subunit RsxC [Eubacteriales bacterium]|nr:electron transport complex subunit RsxC [Eubacteriales bacterium]MDD4134667.1 electron transport complex subunit RsxC [Eubacteriales bacterium]NLO13479.1 electron transport complex subunit RsxC [Clostridiales bacterium]
MSKLSFRGGIHPLKEKHEGKEATKSKPIRPYVPEEVCIPVDMHLGAPSIPCVKKGDLVKLGQVVAEPAGPRGIPVHASVSGEVTAVISKQQLYGKPSTCILIRNDKQDTWVDCHILGDVETAPADKIIGAIRDAGICGMGGACFPTHAKMVLPEGKTVDTILLNGSECETFITADHRLMLEEPQRVVNGLRAAMRAMGVQKGVIAIEENKMDAYEAIKKAAAGREGISTALLKTKYPQGGEKQLIKAVTGREVPSGGLPMDAHVVVLNVATAAAITDAVTEGKPSIARITTVTGIVNEPSNLLVRIGTSVSELITACGGTSEEPGKLFFGGSMTGLALPDDSVSVTKANNCLVVVNKKDAALQETTECIRCSRCIAACPIMLNPQRLNILCEAGNLGQAKKENVMDCILCHSCHYVCPARINFPFKEAKEKIAARRI